MKIFDPNNFPPNPELPVPPAINKQSRREYKEGNRAFIPVKNNATDGLYLNNSDDQLIKDHLNQYLASDSLRLEIQINRLTESLDKTQQDLKGLSLLPDSELKSNQQKVLLAKRQNTYNALNRCKEEYKQISPIHRFALWVKDTTKKTNNNNKLVKFIYGRNGEFLGNLKEANQSLQLLVDKASDAKLCSGNVENEQNIIEILKQFDKIESEIVNEKKDYLNRQRPKLATKCIKLFQKIYYGYELPENKT